MLLVRRYPQDKPKRPKAPKMTAHFAANWHARTDLPLSIFWRWWKSAQFLGETDDVGRHRHPTHWGQTGCIRYYALNPEWVVLVTHPATGQPRLASVWHRAWFEQQWAAAIRQTERLAAKNKEPRSRPKPQPAADVPDADQEGLADELPKSARETAPAGLACASVEACT